MNAMQLTLPSTKHLNRGLFSDYYLDEIVPARADWLPLTVGARSLLEALRTRLAAIKPETLDEAQLEDQWIKYVLEQLGWHASVQVKIRYQATGYRKPDYGLTPDATQARALGNQIYSPAELRAGGVLAVADAKKWGVNLDQAARGERNPSQQIDEYLRYSECAWGILTDGRYWRLYERDSSKNNVYYAVDLPALLQTGDLESFLYFYAFFRPTAFMEGGWLTAIREGSESYARRVSDQLEAQVFEALELIAQGFLDYRRNQLPINAETLAQLYEQSLVLLYRLLFMFYAESREILPINRNQAYTKKLSLDALKKAVKHLADMNYLDTGTNEDSYYSWLSTLFFYIDKGAAEYDIPAYNGRLFSAEDHPFLAEKKVGDKAMAQALDKMARVPDADERNANRLAFVDYRDLQVRHLGAIVTAHR